MSTFTNVSGEDRDLYVDGHPYSVVEGGLVTVPDEFDYQLADQPAWQAAVPVVPVPASTTEPVPASTTEPVPASEGDN